MIKKIKNFFISIYNFIKGLIIAIIWIIYLIFFFWKNPKGNPLQ